MAITSICSNICNVPHAAAFSYSKRRNHDSDGDDDHKGNNSLNKTLDIFCSQEPPTSVPPSDHTNTSNNTNINKTCNFDGENNNLPSSSHSVSAVNEKERHNSDALSYDAPLHHLPHQLLSMLHHYINDEKGEDARCISAAAVVDWCLKSFYSASIIGKIGKYNVETIKTTTTTTNTSCQEGNHSTTTTTEKKRTTARSRIKLWRWQEYYFRILCRVALLLLQGYILIILCFVSYRCYKNIIMQRYINNPNYNQLVQQRSLFQQQPLPLTWKTLFEYFLNVHRDAMLIWYRTFLLQPLFLFVFWRSFFAGHDTDYHAIDMIATQAQGCSVNKEEQEEVIINGPKNNNHKTNESIIPNMHSENADSNSNQVIHNMLTRERNHRRPSLHEAFPKSSFSNIYSSNKNGTSEKSISTVSFSSTNHHHEYNQMQPPNAFCHQQQYNHHHNSKNDNISDVTTTASSSNIKIHTTRSGLEAEEEEDEVPSCAGPVFQHSTYMRNIPANDNGGTVRHKQQHNAGAKNDTYCSSPSRGHVRFEMVYFGTLPSSNNQHNTLLMGSNEALEEVIDNEQHGPSHMRTHTAPFELFSGVNHQARIKSFVQLNENDDNSMQNHSSSNHNPSTQYQCKLPKIRSELLLCDSEDIDDNDKYLNQEQQQQQLEQDENGVSIILQSMSVKEVSNCTKIGPGGSWKGLYERCSKMSTLTSNTITTTNSPINNSVQQNKKLVRKNLSLFLLQSLHSFPTGIAKSIYKLHTSNTHPLKIWIVDNSGSMRTGDGKKMLESKGRVKQMVPCTRWDELRDAVLYHATLHKELGGAIMFRLLNDPNWVLHQKKNTDADVIINRGDTIPQVVGVCVRKEYERQQLNKDAKDESISKKNNAWNNTTRTNGLLSLLPFTSSSSKTTTAPNTKMSKKQRKKECWEGCWKIDLGYKLDNDTTHWRERAQQDLERVEKVMRMTEPRYTTSLARHMFAIHDQLLPMTIQLKQENQKVVIVIASDGVPNEVDAVYSAMSLLQKLPVLLLIRLCTDDERAIHFYKTLELDFQKVDIEILDDFEAEAEEVFTMNPWMNYAMPIQRAREWGFRHPLLATLRERPLTHEELRDFCAMLFGVNDASNLPHPKQDWDLFSHDIDALQERESRQWNPIHKSTRKWIDMMVLAKTYGGKAEKTKLKRGKKLRKARRRIADVIAG